MSRGRRALAALAAFVVVLALGFLVVELTPGDPAAVQLGLHAGEAQRQVLREALGLHGGLARRFVVFLAHAARGDLGRSYADGRPVALTIAERLPSSAVLALAALGLTWLLAVPLALARDRRLRGAIELLVALGYALPVPALALALIALGAPYGAGAGAVLAGAACLQPLLLPRTYAELARALDEALHGDELRALRAAGAPPGRVLRAALRGQALRLTTLAALQLPAIVSGAAIVEVMFGLPGVGLLAFDALARRDHPVLLGLVIVGGAITIAANLAVDLLAPLLDPRLAAPRVEPRA